MYSGMFYVTGSHYDYMDNDTVKYIMLVIVAAPNLIFLLYWLYHMRTELMKELFKKKWFSLISLDGLRRYNEALFYQSILKED